MKTYKITETIVMLLLCSNCYASEVIRIHGTLTPEQREAEKLSRLYADERYTSQVQGEIKRHHQIQLEKEKIEVLARLKEFGASKVNVSAYSSSKSSNKNSQIQEQE